MITVTKFHLTTAGIVAAASGAVYLGVSPWIVVPAVLAIVAGFTFIPPLRSFAYQFFGWNPPSLGEILSDLEGLTSSLDGKHEALKSEAAAHLAASQIAAAHAASAQKQAERAATVATNLKTLIAA